VTTLFVVFRYLIKDIFLYYHLSSSSSHNLIPLLATCGSVSHHLFGLPQRSRLHSNDDFKELDVGCNFSFHVVNLSSCNLLQIQCYCICLAFGGGVVKDIGVVLDYDSNCRVLI
jgi:hypothetical protein